MTKATIPGNKRDREKLLKANRGVLRAVAMRLGVTQAAVSQVFSGRATSARIRQAILDELSLRGNGRLPAA